MPYGICLHGLTCCVWRISPQVEIPRSQTAKHGKTNASLSRFGRVVERREGEFTWTDCPVNGTVESHSLDKTKSLVKQISVPAYERRLYCAKMHITERPRSEMGPVSQGRQTKKQPRRPHTLLLKAPQTTESNVQATTASLFSWPCQRQVGKTRTRTWTCVHLDCCCHISCFLA